MKVALKFVGIVMIIFVLSVSAARVVGLKDSSFMDNNLNGIQHKMNREVKRLLPLDYMKKIIKDAAP